MPDFDVSVHTIRCGTHTVRVVVDEAAAARRLMQSEPDADQHRCTTRAGTDEVKSIVLDTGQVGLGRTLDRADG